MNRKLKTKDFKRLEMDSQSKMLKNKHYIEDSYFEIKLVCGELEIEQVQNPDVGYGSGKVLGLKFSGSLN